MSREETIAAGLRVLADLIERGGQEIRLVSLQACAERLGIDERSVRRLIRRGELPAQKVGGRVLVRDLDVQAFIQRGHELSLRRRMRRAVPAA
jgi:excisionase family DNA binding protein